jgi:hypothetical protein
MVKYGAAYRRQNMRRWQGGRNGDNIDGAAVTGLINRCPYDRLVKIKLKLGYSPPAFRHRLTLQSE